VFAVSPRRGEQAALGRCLRRAAKDEQQEQKRPAAVKSKKENQKQNDSNIIGGFIGYSEASKLINRQKIAAKNDCRRECGNYLCKHSSQLGV